MASIRFRIATHIDYEIDASEIGAYEEISDEECTYKLLKWWDEQDREVKNDALLNPDVVGVLGWDWVDDADPASEEVEE